MKIKSGFVLRKVCDDYMVVPIGARSIDFKSVMKLNETGAFLFEKMQNEISEDELVQSLLDEYEVSQEIAKAEIKAFTENLIKIGVAQ